MGFDLNTLWTDATIVSIDTETTGKYPLESQLCEVAAVKWSKGQQVGSFSTLVKPDHLMGQEVIDIHHITNEMVVNAPKISEKIAEFAEFVGDAFVVGHHSPFDLGFLALELEKNKIKLSTTPAFCSSLLSRVAFPLCSNHRLQTLVKELNLPGGEAHRALTDTINCLQLTLKCFAALGPNMTVGDILQIQKKKILWQDFSILQLRCRPALTAILDAFQQKSDVQITYQGGSQPGTARTVKPIGIVRNPDADFLVATATGEEMSKRYFLDKITKSAI